MAQQAYTCESCGTGVTPKEVAEGGAYFDGEHCYCAICVSRLMQKVRTAQRGGRVKTTGIVFQKGLVPVSSRTPNWLLYTIVGEALLAAILLVVLLIPTEIELPGRDAVVQEEAKIKTLLAQADEVLAEPERVQEALSLLERANNLAAGTAWTHLVRERLDKADKLREDEARESYIEVEKLYNAQMDKGEFDLALSVLEQFPQEYRDTAYWKVDIGGLRTKAEFGKEANKAYMDILARVIPLTRTQNYDAAIELLRAFPDKYAATPASSRVSEKLDEVTDQRDKLVEMKRKEQEQRETMAAQLEKTRREREERFQREAEERDRRRAAAEARRVEEEARKREEEARRAEQEKKEPGVEPEEEPEPVAVGPKGKWEEVKLAHENAAEFPFRTHQPDLAPLKRSAMGGDVLFLPYPHEGKLSGFGVKELEDSIVVDSDADGKADKQLAKEGGFVVLKISYEEKKEVSCAIEIINDGERLQYRRHGWQTGRYKGVSISVIDENSNAEYNEIGKDAVVFGNSKCAAVLGNVVEIKGKLYEMEVQKDGSSLRLRTIELPAGQLFLMKSYKGRGKVNYLVVYGTVKIDKDKYVVSFELSGQRKALEVPAGEYYIRAGEVMGPGNAKIQIRSSPKSKKFKVKAGKLAAYDWGAPGVFDFKYTLHKDGTLRVRPSEVFLYGPLGERYRGWGPKMIVPRVQVMNEAGKIIADQPFPHTSDYEDYYVFEYLVPVKEKLKVRIVGDAKFLGPCESEWK